MKLEIRVLIADDHPVVRKGLQFCLARKPRLKLVGEAVNGEEALEKALALKPDVVLLDISMPGRDGLAVTTALRKEAPQIKVLIFSVHNDRECILRIIQAGANGYISKSAPSKEFLDAIESVHDGGAFFNLMVAQEALNDMRDTCRRQKALTKLTKRQREVVTHVARGRSNKEIANALGISVRTVEAHLANIRSRLDIPSIAGFTKFAIANGLVTLEETGIPQPE